MDLMVYVPSPDDAARIEILKIHTAKMPLSPSVSFDEISSHTKGYSGADLQSVCREAAIEAIRRNSESPLITQEDFLSSLSRVKPALSSEAELGFLAFKRG